MVSTSCVARCPGGVTVFKLEGKLDFIPNSHRGNFTVLTQEIRSKTSANSSWLSRLGLEFDFDVLDVIVQILDARLLLMSAAGIAVAALIVWCMLKFNPWFRLYKSTARAAGIALIGFTLFQGGGATQANPMQKPFVKNVLTSCQGTETASFCIETAYFHRRDCRTETASFCIEAAYISSRDGRFEMTPTLSHMHLDCHVDSHSRPLPPFPFSDRQQNAHESMDSLSRPWMLDSLWAVQKASDGVNQFIPAAPFILFPIINFIFFRFSMAQAAWDKYGPLGPPREYPDSNLFSDDDDEAAPTEEGDLKEGTDKPADAARTKKRIRTTDKCRACHENGHNRYSLVCYYHPTNVRIRDAANEKQKMDEGDKDAQQVPLIEETSNIVAAGSSVGGKRRADAGTPIKRISAAASDVKRPAAVGTDKLLGAAAAKKTAPVVAETPASHAAQEPAPLVAQEPASHAVQEPAQLAAQEPALIDAQQLDDDAKKRATFEAKKLAAIDAKKRAAFEAKKLAAIDAKKRAAIDAKKRAAIDAKKRAAIDAKKSAPDDTNMAAVIEQQKQAAELPTQKAATDAAADAAAKKAAADAAAKKAATDVAAKKAAAEAAAKKAATDVAAKKAAAEAAAKKAAAKKADADAAADDAEKKAAADAASKKVAADDAAKKAAAKKAAAKKAAVDAAAKKAAAEAAAKKFDAEEAEDSADEVQIVADFSPKFHAVAGVQSPTAPDDVSEDVDSPASPVSVDSSVDPFEYKQPGIDKLEKGTHFRRIQVADAVPEPKSPRCGCNSREEAVHMLKHIQAEMNGMFDRQISNLSAGECRGSPEDPRRGRSRSPEKRQSPRRRSPFRNPARHFIPARQSSSSRRSPPRRQGQYPRRQTPIPRGK